jgi:hypothetical protein
MLQVSIIEVKTQMVTAYRFAQINAAFFTHEPAEVNV